MTEPIQPKRSWFSNASHEILARPWLVFLLFLLIAVMLITRSCETAKQEAATTEALQVQTHKTQQVAVKYRDKVIEVAQVQAGTVTTTQALATYIQMYDSLQKEVNRLQKLVPQATLVASQQTSLPAIRMDYLPDRGRSHQFSVDKLPDYYIAGRTDSAGVTIDSLELQNQIHLQLSSRRAGFLGLGHRQTVVTAYNTNPYVHTASLQSVVVQTPRPKWRVGFQVGYGYSLPASGPPSPAPYIGVGLSYSPF